MILYSCTCLTPSEHTESWLNCSNCDNAWACTGKLISILFFHTHTFCACLSCELSSMLQPLLWSPNFSYHFWVPACCLDREGLIRVMTASCVGQPPLALAPEPTAPSLLCRWDTKHTPPHDITQIWSGKLKVSSLRVIQQRIYIKLRVCWTCFLI